MAESKIPTAEKIAEWKRTIADPNVKEFAKEPLRNLLAKFGEAEVEVVKEVEKVVTPKGTRGRKPSGTTTRKPTTRKPKEQVISISKEFDAKTGQIVSVKRVNGKVVKPKSTRGRKPSTPKSQSDIESAKAELKKKFGKTEEECEKIIDQYKALRSTAKKDEVKKQEATATNRTRIEKLKKDDNIIVGTDVKTADATIETAKEEVVAKIEQEIEIVTDKAETEATKVVEKDTTLTPTEKKEKVKKVVEKEVKDKTKVIVKRVIVDTSALLTAISSKLGEFDKDSQKEFLIKLRSDIDKLLTKYAFGGDVMGATQRMNITQSNMSSSSVNSFGKGGKTMYADGGLVEMFTANDDSDYVDDVLEQIKHLYSVNDDVLEEIVNDRNFDDVDELQMYFENAYFTYANTDADLGEEYVEMIGSISELGQDTLERYFDFKKFGLDLAYDYDEYSGHYFNQNYAKGGTTKSRRYDNGGGVDSYKIGDKFRVLKGIYGDYNSPRYANKEFEVINIRDGKYIDARTPNGTTETFDIKNIEKINFDNGGGVGKVVWKTNKDMDSEGSEFNYYTAKIGIYDLVVSPNFTEYTSWKSSVEINSRVVGMMSESYSVKEAKEEAIRIANERIANDGRREKRLKGEMFDNGGGVNGLKMYQGIADIEYTNLDGVQEDFKSVRYIKATSEQEAKKLFISRLELDTTRKQDWEFESIDIDLVTDPQQLEQAEARGYLSTQKMKNRVGAKGVVVFDNEGETYDRYTIFTPDGSVYGMSDNPMSPNGFNQYLGDNTEITMGSHLGKRLSEIPSSIKIAVGDRMED